MRREPPAWWSIEPRTWAARALTPIGTLYDVASHWRRQRVRAFHAPVPVICVGNFTVGGAGKTPTALAIARLLTELGRRPGFLSRGYGGRLRGPHWVSPTDLAADVGDEPLLLMRSAPTMIARDRVAGAKAMTDLAATQSIDSIIMDDGMQNPSIAKDFVVAAVDAAAGIGNGLVMPAGPLRMSLRQQWPLVDAVAVIGPARLDRTAFLASSGKLLLQADIVSGPNGDWLAGRRVIAFAGIGRPQKFFDSVTTLGAIVVAAMPFPDHHAYDETECAALLDHADRLGADLVTTEKDWVRLGTDGRSGTLRQQARPVPIELKFSEPSRGRLLTLLATALRQ